MMAIMGIGSYGRIQNVYAYGNTHFNQVSNSAVSPVTKVRPVVAPAGQEDELKFGVTFRTEQNAMTDAATALKGKETLTENYRGQDTVSYDLSNPYEMARKNIEGSLLLGMNFDILA